MTTRITHRDLRNNSSDVLRRVAGGEIIEVTNNGDLAAILIPPTGSEYDRLLAAGKIQPAQGATRSFSDIARVTSDMTTEQMLADVRGRW